MVFLIPASSLLCLTDELENIQFLKIVFSNDNERKTIGKQNQYVFVFYIYNTFNRTKQFTSKFALNYP